MENALMFNKSYRIYIGHGNWINLSAATTQELKSIFERGLPTRYRLGPGLCIDIIPHDVDCNSRNIDMLGLMRADLVYDKEENKVHQSMSGYVRSLLEEQGIIDAFPPCGLNEPHLPSVSQLGSHRHLSLVPSTTGITRRGPKAYPEHDDSSSASSKTKHALPKKKPNKRSPKKIKKTESKKATMVHLIPSYPTLSPARVWTPRTAGFEFHSTEHTHSLDDPSHLVLQGYELPAKDRLYDPYTSHSGTLVDYEPPLLSQARSTPFDSTLTWPMKDEPWLSSLDYSKDILSTDSSNNTFRFDPMKSITPSSDP